MHDLASDGGIPRVDNPAGIAAGQIGVVPEHTDNVVDVDLGLDETLAGVQRLQASHRVLVGGQAISDPTEHFGALTGWGARPGSVVEGGAAGGDGRARIARGCLTDSSYFAAIGWTANCAGGP